MIKLTSLNKYYNKNKTNELQVINNTSIELPLTGLVCLIGKSGCGKTTLLNVIGGLDKPNDGKISFEDITFDNYNMKKIDLFRKDNIGYIFQNYLLLEDKTVYENLKIALELIYITDIEEQNKRIEYALKSVGMYKFRKKLAGRLSGGQQQRVSIARALVKECKVIIADEPTGNLDSENTIEVMNILKKLSEKTLVLLVTHNPEIADFYGDRILTISDGKIVSDKLNHASTTSLNIISDKKIYLKDLNNTKVHNELLSINLYSDEESNSASLNIVIKNNTIYIDSSSNIQLVKQSNISLINDHYKKLEKEEVKEYDFDISWHQKAKKKNIFLRLFLQLKKSFIEFIHTKKISKVFNIIFLVIGVIMASCIISAANYQYVDTLDFSTEEAYKINDPKYNIKNTQTAIVDDNDVHELIDKCYIDNIYLTQPRFDTVIYSYNSNYREYFSFIQHLYPFDIVKEDSLLDGKEPQFNEVVIGKQLADRMIKELKLDNDYKLLIGLDIDNFLISGVSSVETNSVYYNSQVYYNFRLYSSDNVISFDPKRMKQLNNAEIRHKEYEEYVVTSGSDIVNDNEILINEEFKMSYDKTIYKDNLKNEYKVVGYFTGSNAKFIVANRDLLSCIFENNEFSHYTETRAEVLLNQEYIDFSLDTIRNSESKLPTKDNEILVSVYSAFEIGDIVDVLGTNFYVVGYYYCENVTNNNLVVIANKNAYLHFTYKIANELTGIGGYTYELSEENINNIINEGFDVYTSFALQQSIILSYNEEERNIQLVFILIMLLISMIYVYFSNRSKLINEIREIGVYRCIGATRSQLIKRYLSNIFVNTTLTSVLGYLIVTIGYSYISIKIAIIVDTITSVPIVLLFTGMVCLYIINLTFGLLPIVLLMRKTPAEIISKYDI